MTLDSILTLLPHEAFWNVVNDESQSASSQVAILSCALGWMKVWPPIGPPVGWADTDKPALSARGRGKVGCLPGGRVSGWGLDPRPWTTGWMVAMTEPTSEMVSECSECSLVI